MAAQRDGAAGGARSGAGRDPGVSARPAGQVALGDQLLVGLDDDAAGDAELVGERRAWAAARCRAAAVPPRIASRIDASIWRCSATPESRVSWTSRSPAGARIGPLQVAPDRILSPSTNSWKPRSPCARSSTRPTSPSTASSRGRTCGRRSAVPATSAPAQIQTELLLSCDALLMGRRTYDGFAPVWPTRSGDPYSDHINAMPKYVVSTHADRPGVGQHAGDRRRRRRARSAALKEEPGKDIVQYGFGAVSRLLLEHGLLDELRLWVHPLIVGSRQPGRPAVRRRARRRLRADRRHDAQRRHRRPQLPDRPGPRLDGLRESRSRSCRSRPGSAHRRELTYEDVVATAITPSRPQRRRPRHQRQPRADPRPAAAAGRPSRSPRSSTSSTSSGTSSSSATGTRSPTPSTTPAAATSAAATCTRWAGARQLTEELLDYDVDVSWWVTPDGLRARLLREALPRALPLAGRRVPLRRAVLLQRGDPVTASL